MSDQKEKAQEDSDEASDGTRQESSARKPKTTIGKLRGGENKMDSNLFPQRVTGVESRRERYSTTSVCSKIYSC